MPEVLVDKEIGACRDDVWRTILDIEKYPSFMENVLDVRVVEHAGSTRISTWSVLLKGSNLEWTEVEDVDEARGRIEFHQTDGDLERFDGYWQLEERPGGVVAVSMRVDFEIGIPLLAEMLNPVAARALADNSTRMLEDIDSKLGPSGVRASVARAE